MKLVFVPKDATMEVRFAGETLGTLSNRHFEAARAKAIEVNRQVNEARRRDSGANLFAPIARQAMQPYLLPN